MTTNAPYHLPTEAGEVRCSRAGGCGCYAAFDLNQHLASAFNPLQFIDQIEARTFRWLTARVRALESDCSVGSVRGDVAANGLKAGRPTCQALDRSP